MPPPYTKAQFYKSKGLDSLAQAEACRVDMQSQEAHVQPVLDSIRRHPKDAPYRVERGVRSYLSGRSAPWSVLASKSFDLCVPYNGQSSDAAGEVAKILTGMQGLSVQQALVVNRWGAAAFGLFLMTGGEARTCAALTQDGLEPAFVFYAFLEASCKGTFDQPDKIWHHWPETAEDPMDLWALPTKTYLGTFLNVPILFAEDEAFGNADTLNKGRNAWCLYTLADDKTPATAL